MMRFAFTISTGLLAVVLFSGCSLYSTFHTPSRPEADSFFFGVAIDDEANGKPPIGSSWHDYWIGRYSKLSTSPDYTARDANRTIHAIEQRRRQKGLPPIDISSILRPDPYY